MNFPIFNHLKNDNLFQDKTYDEKIEYYVQNTIFARINNNHGH